MHRYAAISLGIFIALLPFGSSASFPANIAHRGFSHAHPDNTIPSIIGAWGAGADTVELDVRSTRDGILVLFHDEQADEKSVDTLSYDELQARTPDFHVPTLAEALRHFPADKKLLLDLKGGGASFLSQVLKVTSAAEMTADCLTV